MASGETLRHLLLESPWSIIVVLVGVWAVLRVISVRRRSWRWHLAALGVLVLAGGLALLAWAVDTPREVVSARTRELVGATEPLELATLDRLILPAAAIEGPGGQTWRRYREVRDRLAGEPVDSQNITHLSVEMGPDREAAEAELAVTTRFERRLAGRPIPSRWRLRWEKRDGAWRVTAVRWLELGVRGQEPRPGLIPNQASSEKGTVTPPRP